MAGEKPRIKPDTQKYVNVKTHAGTASKACGDEVSLVLAGANLDEVYELASAVSMTSITELQESYGHLNNGQQRMALGNRIRGLIRGASSEYARKTFDDHAQKLRAKIEVRTEAAEEAKAKAKADREALAELKKLAKASKKKEKTD